MFEAVRAQLSHAVPYAVHTGVEILAVDAGEARARLVEQPHTLNHVGSQHAGALFTLAEAASGAAMVGAFLPRMASMRPLAASASIDYLAVARGTIEATARIDGDAAALQATLDQEGRVRFPVTVELADETGRSVARVTVDWHLKSLAEAA
ncbi:YiiD C-terminal domain-containing protein [Erythrobacter mangrovi]|uniref:YiiD C-terminal domain-containing protein n=2 Tax=Erythrobacter mangrovi TaxID=2739433 RepID=A0A7D3XKL0_9SPHN|nr:YiiD C-terminal domain-containing protein [Erythrobacter mangrovi]